MKKKFPFYSIGYVLLILLLILYFVPVSVDRYTESFILLKGIYVLCAYLAVIFVAVREVLVVVKRYFGDGDELLRRFAIIRFVFVFGLCLFILYFNYTCFDLTDFFYLLKSKF